MTEVSSLPVRRFRHDEAADYLSRIHGIPISPKTLANKTLAKRAVIGGGPLFRKAGRYPLHEQPALDAYAEKILGPSVQMTAQLPQRAA